MKEKYTVVVVEDHTIVRDGLISLISSNEQLEVVGEAGDGLEASSVIDQLKPDLVLLDLSMPKMDGFDVITDVKKSSPRTKVLVLTVHSTEGYVRKCLRTGADGYILKKATRNELMSAVMHILAGESYIYPGIADSIIQGYLATPQEEQEISSFDSLTRREREILKLVAEGYKNREIADYLCISRGTVVQHRHHLMKKLKLHNTAALTNYAIEQGLVTK